MNRVKRAPLVILMAVVCVVPLIAEKLWERPPGTWSKEDCEKLLSDSPWAFREGYEVASVQQSGFNLVIYCFRLASAKPVMLAARRMEALSNEAETESTISNQPVVTPDEIKIEVSFLTKPDPLPMTYDLKSHVRNFFRQATLDELKETTFLQSSRKKNVKIPISRYIYGDGWDSYPTFVFPRLDENGAPLFDGSEKSITLTTHIKPTAGNSYRISVKMKPSKMIFAGEFSM